MGGRSEHQHIQAGGQNMLAIELVWGSGLFVRVRGTGTRDRCRWQGGWRGALGNVPAQSQTSQRTGRGIATRHSQGRSSAGPVSLVDAGSRLWELVGSGKRTDRRTSHRRSHLPCQ